MNKNELIQNLIQDMNKITNEDSVLMSTKQVQKVLKISKSKMEDMRRKEKRLSRKELLLPNNILPSLKIGRSVFYSKRIVAEYLTTFSKEY